MRGCEGTHESLKLESCIELEALSLRVCELESCQRAAEKGGDPCRLGPPGPGNAGFRASIPPTPRLGAHLPERHMGVDTGVQP